MKVNKLKAILMERELTQMDLYRMIATTSKQHLPRIQINQIVNGKKTNFTILTLMKICRALEVTPNEILDKSSYSFLFND